MLELVFGKDPSTSKDSFVNTRICVQVLFALFIPLFDYQLVEMYRSRKRNNH
jgi:hypothetical protein